jgi:hypothetical protein
MEGAVVAYFKVHSTIYLERLIYHRVHKSPPSVPMLSQINSVHTIQVHVFKFHFHIILSSMAKSSK